MRGRERERAGGKGEEGGGKGASASVVEVRALGRGSWSVDRPTAGKVPAARADVGGGGAPPALRCYPD